LLVALSGTVQAAGLQAVVMQALKLAAPCLGIVLATPKVAGRKFVAPVVAAQLLDIGRHQ
jgi:hypothetical protein